ncbi:MAG: ABC transporter substrate-binding protein [Variovorax paradoxus]|nr:MAG: ABC transporter substrate-binding protein [Variovorax paradoxus]PZQ17582.1 MAG: ABC transporter substrate-binding protein [Variovorax paradoxus]
MQKTRRRLAAALCALGLGLAVGQAFAQAYPSKPVKLVVPYPPGGPTDIVARVIAQRLQTQTGQAFVVENLPGAGGNTGAAAVARAAPDGYTLLVATTAHAINPSLFKNLSYQFGKDFAPITQLTAGPLVIVVNPALPVKTVGELINLAKAKPGELNFASSGNGQSTHLAGELFNATAGTKIRHVPYKGSAPALTDTMGGQTQLMFDTMLSAMPHVKGGKLRAIAVTSAQRSPAAPDLPTVAENLPGFDAIAWNGLLAPANTPREIVAKLSAELRTAMEQPEVRERFEAQGFAGAWTPPEAFAGFIHAEIDKWAKVVQVSGATVE